MCTYTFIIIQIIRFLSPIPYHLNVSQSNGQVCIGLLKADQWNPTTSCIEKVLNGIVVTLAQPQLDSYVDDEVNTEYFPSQQTGI